MKKLILSFALLLSSFILFADPLAFWGITLGSPISAAKKTMKDRGWSLAEQSKGSLVYKKTNGTYAGCQINNIQFDIDETKICVINVNIDSEEDYDNVLKGADAIIKKFCVLEDGENISEGFHYYDETDDNFFIYTIFSGMSRFTCMPQYIYCNSEYAQQSYDYVHGEEEPITDL